MALARMTNLKHALHLIEVYKHILLCFLLFCGSGEGFGTGVIDLGGLQISQVSTFNKIWAANEGGPDNLGVTFYEPSAIPDGFFMLGSYSEPNNISHVLSGWVLVGKDVVNDSSAAALKPPTDYTLVWSSESLEMKQDGVAYIWLPISPDGYKAIGHVVTSSPSKPDLNKVRCVRVDFTDSVDNEAWIWGPGKNLSSNVMNVYSSRPGNGGVEAEVMGVPTGTFVAQSNGSSALGLMHLKNLNRNLNIAMPNADELEIMIRAYSPRVYIHPSETYFPSSVAWFFQYGAILYTRGREWDRIGVTPTGSNLPQGGGNDGEYWIDLPQNNEIREKVKEGDLSSAEAYIHAKPMFGATYTDIQIWLFYPFNGPAKLKIEFINVSLGQIGQHVGDWEHVTLRISNFDGKLQGMYFSQHSKGSWVDASKLEMMDNRPVVYASLHGHAMFPYSGLALQGGAGIGLRNDCDKSNNFIDTWAKFTVMSAEYLGSVYAEPVWLNYAREWGPKIDTNIDDELNKIAKDLPGLLRKVFRKVVRRLPDEVLAQEGPTGPKWKDNWNGDERS